MERRPEQLNEQRRGQDGRGQESVEVYRRGQSGGPTERTDSESRAGTPRHYWRKPSILGDGNEERLAQGLGYLSIALGVAELAAPRSFARLIGVSEHRFWLRLVGLREIASGVGILTQQKPAGWLWARVAGDIMDLALLGMAFTSDGAKPQRVAAATAAVAGITALDVFCSQELSEDTAVAPDEERGVRVRKVIIVNRSPEEIYRYWRDFQNLPRFMKNLESVQVLSEERSHWVAKGPGGKKVEWNAEIIEDRPNERIAWRSFEGADVPNSGSVSFEPAPGGRGTLVRVEMQYSPPGGLLGATFAKLFGRAPEQQIEEDLRRFKQVMETGEIITTEGQPAGRASSTSWKYDHAMRRVASAVSG